MNPNRIILAAAACLLIVLFAPSAQAENYGCVSKKQCTKMERLILKKFGTGWSGQTALRIARCESGLNPRAVNWGDGGGVSAGIFQVNHVHRHSGESLLTFAKRMWNPVANINYAYRLSRGGKSWSAWSCY